MTSLHETGLSALAADAVMLNTRINLGQEVRCVFDKNQYQEELARSNVNAVLKRIAHLRANDRPVARGQ
jgi:hypothetical protein